MEIEITKHNGRDKSPETNYYPILNYQFISQPQSLLLVSEGDLSDDNGSRKLLEIKKVQFIASCTTSFSEKPLMAAFCVDGNGEMIPYLLSSLSGDYYPAGESFRLVDYSSYAKICELTGETKLSLAEFIAETSSGTIGTNTFLEDDQQTYINYDKQKEYLKELANRKN